MSSGDQHSQKGRIVEKSCKLHPDEEVKAFCKTDLCSICFKCLLVEHRKHDVVMLDEFSNEEFKENIHLFQDKIEDQINRLDVVRDKVGSIKENYDKKFDGLFK